MSSGVVAREVETDTASNQKAVKGIPAACQEKNTKNRAANGAMAGLLKQNLGFLFFLPVRLLSPCFYLLHGFRLATLGQRFLYWPTQSLGPDFPCSSLFSPRRAVFTCQRHGRRQVADIPPIFRTSMSPCWCSRKLLAKLLERLPSRQLRRGMGPLDQALRQRPRSSCPAALQHPEWKLVLLQIRRKRRGYLLVARRITEL